LKKIFLLPQAIYSIYCLLLFLACLLIVFPLVLICLLLPKKAGDICIYYILKAWAYTWHYICFMFPKVYNKEKIDHSKAYIITPNHQSFIDASLLYMAMAQRFKPLGKVEVGNIPLFGLIYKAVVITVDRSSMTARVQSFRKLNDEIENGLSVVLFPEGTFKDTPQKELLPFQDGAISLAIQNKKQLLPMFFLDAAKRVHPSSLLKFSPGVQRIFLLPPIATHLYTKENTQELKEKLFTLMQEAKTFAEANKPNEVWNFCCNFMKENDLIS
jgi:1-acyl-sn-glycerol-3-phosphate acyltransferase